VVEKILGMAALNFDRVCREVEIVSLPVREKVGGGGRSRTYGAADLSRADSDSKLLDLLTEILLKASPPDLTPTV
jgi:hypothetical protein